MEPKVRDTLNALIVRYGHALSEDPPRCEAMLRDLCGQHKREIFILVNALKQRVAADLLGGNGGLPAPLMIGRLRKRLEDELALTAEAAHWAVETWALALRVIAGPVPLAAATTAPPRAQPPVVATTPIRSPAGPAPRPLAPDMIQIPAGRFLMGSPPDEPGRYDNEGPQHWVQIPAFALGKHAVTFDQWDACVAAGGCNHRPEDQGWGRGQRPVINVSWDDAQQYIRWLSRETGKTYRLPSEAEWEYATRAGTNAPFSTGDCISTTLANYNGDQDYNGCGAKTGVFLGKTQPVASYPENPWGLYDMHGNIWEWVEDCWHDSYAGAPTDATPWRRANSPRHVVRGGSWSFYPRFLRSAYRYRYAKDLRDLALGFRVARTLTP
jgi:formylglycine-generating enzyme required for sulfatase activity